MKRLVLLLALALPAAASDGLVKLAEVWAAVKYEHPWTMQRELDFDGMLVRAIPNVRAAKTDAEMAKAIGGMLAELGDPATRVVENVTPPKSDRPLSYRTRDVLVINLGSYPENDLFTHVERLSREIATSRAVVFDVRTPGVDRTSWIIPYLNSLVKENVPPLPMRGVFHSGYPPQSGSSSGGYYSAIQTTLGGAVSVRPQTASRMERRIVFVTDGDSLPAVAAALWWNGNAAIVSEKPLSEAAVGAANAIELSETHTARIRTSELAASGLAADEVVPRGSDDATLKRGIELASAFTPFTRRPPATASAFTPHRVVEKSYADMHYPDLPYRLLALFRVWTIIDRFYPYKHLIVDWEPVLREFIPRFENAKNEVEYAAAVLELVARVEDGHSGAFGHRAVNEIIGHWTLPVDIRYVEGSYVVTAKRGNVPEGTPLDAGDVIVSVDGEPIEQRVQRFWKYRTASHETARRNAVVSTALRGPKESTAVLVVRKGDGATRTVNVPRVAQSMPPRPPEGEPYRILDGNIGYVDLVRLTPAQVDAMFDALMNTKAIVFDMRGYPRGTAWPIAPRINTTKAKVGATFRRVQLPRYAGDEGSSGYYFEQPLPKSDKPVYQGKTLMLIDDRAISQAEHTGLFFEAASGITFVGSNSAGANGDVTNFPLPGGFSVGFTGHDVRHADGRQLQRIGLVPDVRVEPTINGIREGKDEVLARAIAFINNGK